MLLRWILLQRVKVLQSFLNLIFASAVLIPTSISLIYSFTSPNQHILSLEGILEVHFRNEEIEAKKAILTTYHMKGMTLGALGGEKINQACKHLQFQVSF